MNICVENALYIIYMLNYSETYRNNGTYNGLHLHHLIIYNNTNGRPIYGLIFAKTSILEKPTVLYNIKKNNDFIMYLNKNCSIRCYIIRGKNNFLNSASGVMCAHYSARANKKAL